MWPAIAAPVLYRHTWGEPYQPCQCPRCAEEPPLDEPRDNPEEEVLVGRPGLSASVQWRHELLDRFPSRNVPQGGGVYIVMSANRPIYVGQAQSFAGRWGGRMLGLYQLGLVHSTGGGASLSVHFGTLTRNDKTARAVAEHVLIRLLDHAGIASGATLRNYMSTRRFRVLGRIEIQNVLPGAVAKLKTKDVPALRQNVITLTPQQTSTFELLP